MRFGFGHAAALDQDALGAADQALIFQLLAQTAVFVDEFAQTAVRGLRQTDALLQEQTADRLGQDEHAGVGDLGRDRVSLIGGDEQQNPGYGILCHVLRQLMPEFIGQGRVDDDQVKVLVCQPAPRIHAAQRDQKFSLHATFAQEIFQRRSAALGVCDEQYAIQARPLLSSWMSVTSVRNTGRPRRPCGRMHVKPSPTPVP